jgi:4-hydroxy-tetrahydrodipicolinate synthase
MLHRDQLLGALVPAVPIPFNAAGAIDEATQDRYARWMARQPVSGVAVWAHTGRGLRLAESERAVVLSCWRRAMIAPRFVIAAAGGHPDLTEPDQVIMSASRMACQATESGADGLLVHPPVAFRHHPHRDRLILDYHAAIAEAGLPLILFYLYEAAGGIGYTPEVLARLLAMPSVLGMKIATLDSVMTFQDLSRLMEREAPDKVVITGEDRFLGYSLMCGGRAALVGMGAACTGLQAELLRTHRDGEAGRFLELNARVDDLARHTFRAPMEGYIRRMLWCLVHEGVISMESAHDPWGPPLDPDEFHELGECLRRIQALEPRETSS